MKFKTISICAMALAMSLPAGALTLEEVGAKLRGVKCYRDSVSYEVLLASLAEPVTYTMQLESAEAKGDSLAPCKYVIKWSLPAPSGLARGFSAYFEGSHFRFRDKRLQEYHVSELADPFMPGGDVSRGVQMQVQFADLLPQFIGLQFERMASDPSYVTTVTADTLVSGKPSVVVDGVRRINGVDACEYTYILDGKTYLPVKTELENNPGQIGEQSISINYGVPTVKNCRIDLESLVESEPDAFGKYRENTFSLETLPGRPLPRIVAPTIDGSRYVHEREEAFEAPTVFVFLDATVGSTPQVIEDVRKGVDTLPFRADVVWAFLNHRADDVESYVSDRRTGESVLINAGGAARDCGVGTTAPALIFTGADGHVTDIIIGYNKSLPSNVIQKVTNSKYTR